LPHIIARGAEFMARKQQKPAAKSAIVPIAAVGAGLIAAGGLLYGLWRRLAASGTVEYLAPDLGLDKPRPGPDDRAPVAFRPDPTAPVSAGEREKIRPATGPAPSLAEDRGSMRSGSGAQWPDEVNVAADPVP
jgi:hypothetical protein